MSEPIKELCRVCDEPTGRAGKADDSIYDLYGCGPYCEGCRDLNLDQFPAPEADDERENKQP